MSSSSSPAPTSTAATSLFLATTHTNTIGDDADNHGHINPETVAHNKLRAHPVLFAAIGVTHTLLTAGVVFGWASLLAVLRQEEENDALTPSQYASIFTHGAIGNYLSSLPFGLLLDHCGPKKTGVLASLLFASGLLLCSNASSSSTCLDWGFTLLGFSGPAIQLPTLHLARLFPGDAREGGNGAAAWIMSAQAGAFDGGTFVFALLAALHHSSLVSLSSQTFFRLYTVVPLGTLLTAVLYWPNTILPDETDRDHQGSSYVGRSPYLSPAASITTTMLEQDADNYQNSLVDAPLRRILTTPPFYCLAAWTATHILKLNFVVATINDQLDYAMTDDLADRLIQIFGAMLPFGFVVLPVVAHLLGRDTALACFQLANVVGLLYGAVLTFCPGVASFQILVVFVAVATSRQLVYSTVFHQTGALFGFRHYGAILGLVNVMVSAVGLLVQTPLVVWTAERRGGDYTGANAILLAATLPLFGIVYWTTTTTTTSMTTKKCNNKPVRTPRTCDHHEESSRLLEARSPHLSLSFRSVMT